MKTEQENYLLYHGFTKMVGYENLYAVNLEAAGFYKLERDAWGLVTKLDYHDRNWSSDEMNLIVNGRIYYDAKNDRVIAYSASDEIAQQLKHDTRDIINQSISAAEK